MISKISFWKSKENIVIIIGAACIAFGLFFISKNTDFFTASVLSLQEKSFITEKWRDIAYKTNSGYLDIFMSEQGETPQTIDFSIIFNKDTINIDAQNISGQGSRSTNIWDNNSIFIQSAPGENVDKSQSILMLPFSGEMKDILLSEAIAKRDNKKDQNLSIGSLNEIDIHTK